MDLRKADFNQAVDAKIIDNKLDGLKWISCMYPQNTKEEINLENTDYLPSINLWDRRKLGEEVRLIHLKVPL